MKNMIGSVRRYALIAAAIVLAGTPVFPAYVGISVAQAQAAEGFRSLGYLGTVCNWDSVDWDNMTGPEHNAWMILGWSKERWGSGKAPASSSKDWDELTARERRAARNLHYDERTWANTCKGLF